MQEDPFVLVSDGDHEEGDGFCRADIDSLGSGESFEEDCRSLDAVIRGGHTVKSEAIDHRGGGHARIVSSETDIAYDVDDGRPSVHKVDVTVRVVIDEKRGVSDQGFLNFCLFALTAGLFSLAAAISGRDIQCPKK